MPRIEERRFSTSLDCRYIVQIPEGEYDDSVVVVALHGYGMDAETMLRLVATWFTNHRIVSMRAPHPFFRSPDMQSVGYSWATHMQPQESVRLHHAMLQQVLREIGAPANRVLLVGFSQPVSLNYRFVATYPGLVHGVIGVCGGMPKDWETAAYQPIDAALLHIARSEDEIYKLEAARQYHERLSARAQDVEFLELPGGHRFPSLAQPAVHDWVRRKFES